VSFTQRRLPHWYPDGKPLFITWRLHDTIPPHRFFRHETMNSGRAFVCWDRLLDEARHGPSWMRQPEIAGLVAASIRYGSTSLGHYELLSYCVMPNHAHVLVVPKVEPARLLHSINGFQLVSVQFDTDPVPAAPGLLERLPRRQGAHDAAGRVAAGFAVEVVPQADADAGPRRPPNPRRTQMHGRLGSLRQLVFELEPEVLVLGGGPRPIGDVAGAARIQLALDRGKRRARPLVHPAGKIPAVEQFPRLGNPCQRDQDGDEKPRFLIVARGGDPYIIVSTGVRRGGNGCDEQSTDYGGKRCFLS